MTLPNAAVTLPPCARRTTYQITQGLGKVDLVVI